MVDSRGLVVTVRIPNDVLRGRIDQHISKRKIDYPKYSLNDFFLEAARHELDGAITVPAARVEIFPTHEVSENPQPYPAPQIQLGQVSDGFWDRWSRDSKRLEGESREESFMEALRERQAAGLELPQGFLKMSIVSKMAWLRVNDRDEW